MQTSKEAIKELAAKIYTVIVANLKSKHEVDLCGVEHEMVSESVYLAFVFEQEFEKEFQALNETA
jgi:hypothetical protein